MIGRGIRDLIVSRTGTVLLSMPDSEFYCARSNTLVELHSLTLNSFRLCLPVNELNTKMNVPPDYDLKAAVRACWHEMRDKEPFRRHFSSSPDATPVCRSPIASQ